MERPDVSRSAIRAVATTRPIAISRTCSPTANAATSPTRTSASRRRARRWTRACSTGSVSGLYNWEYSASIQHEVTPRVSVDFGYFRRWFGNFAVTDNLALCAVGLHLFRHDRAARSAAPGWRRQHDRRLRRSQPEYATLAPNNLFTLARDYGDQIQQWNGFDLTMNARIRSRPLPAGRHEHRPHADRQLRDPREDSRVGSAEHARTAGS